MSLAAGDLRARRRANLKRLLKPKSIAFIGGQYLEHCIALCRRAGYGGKMHLVNPNRSEIAGLAAVPSIGALPEAPDTAFVALSRERSIEAMAALDEIGAGGAVCHVAGFGELGGEHRDLQQDLAVAAGDLAMIGPNCMGVLNAFDRVALWGADGHFDPVEGPGVALISQSGAFLYGIVNTERAYPMGYGLSLGNQAVIGTADALDFALDDERVGAVGLYCEGLTDGPVLGDALAKALDRRIPVVLLAAGGVPAAAERAVSHTGNLAVPGDFWHALADRYGLIEVTTIKQLVETTKMLAVTGVPAGRRVFFATYSGGAGSLIAEQAPARGLVLPPVGAENQARVRPTLPEVVVVSNPLDLNLPWQSKDGVSLGNAESIARCLADASQGAADAIAMLFDIPRGREGYEAPWLPTLDALIELRQRSGLPVVVSGLLPEGIEPHLRQRLQAHGVAALMGLTETIEALAGAACYGSSLRDESRQTPASLLEAGPGGPLRTLDEWDSKERLAPYGLAMPPRWRGAAEDAAEAAAALGFPVAVKVLDAAIAHKSKLSGVRLNLRSAAEVSAAIAQIRADLGAARPDAPADRFLVEAMAPAPLMELILGIKRHPALGLALLIGRGGVDTEIHRDYALTLLPAETAALERALDRLQIPALSPMARQAVLDAMAAVASFAVDQAAALSELDINPLLVLEDGSVTAVDALMVLTNEPET